MSEETRQTFSLQEICDFVPKFTSGDIKINWKDFFGKAEIIRDTRNRTEVLVKHLLRNMDNIEEKSLIGWIGGLIVYAGKIDKAIAEEASEETFCAEGEKLESLLIEIAKSFEVAKAEEEIKRLLHIQEKHGAEENFGCEDRDEFLSIVIPSCFTAALIRGIVKALAKS